MIWIFFHFYKQNIEFTRNQETFKNSNLFKNDKQKKCHVLQKLLVFIIKNCKNIVPKFIHVKKFFLGK